MEIKNFGMILEMEEIQFSLGNLIALIHCISIFIIILFTQAHWIIVTRLWKEQKQ